MAVLQLEHIVRTIAHSTSGNFFGPDAHLVEQTPIFRTRYGTAAGSMVLAMYELQNFTSTIRLLHQLRFTPPIILSWS